jgi:uncharacterized protein (TIGR03083 family)
MQAGLRPVEPVDVLELFPAERAALLTLLSELTDDEWESPTACSGWSVRDVALHILGGDLGNLSRRRDRLRAAPRPGETLVDLVNRFNDEWVRAGRRLSPRVIRDLLGHTDAPLFAYYATLDLSALGEPVSWAGPDPAPVWLDVAREYTEHWHHQQHIRDAVGRPGLTDRRFLAPVLATFVHALPHTYRETEAANGTSVQLHVTGEAGGDWTVVRDGPRWALDAGAPPRPAARVTLDQSDAWRLLTNGLPLRDAERRATIDGDRHLGEQLLQAVAIIA